MAIHVEPQICLPTGQIVDDVDLVSPNVLAPLAQNQHVPEVGEGEDAEPYAANGERDDDGRHPQETEDEQSRDRLLEIDLDVDHRLVGIFVATEHTERREGDPILRSPAVPREDRRLSPG